ncbi:hypothetical protein Taro_024282 [Colocasia esculenta]|uniref:Uncharacterized protein n=1 Tax=Colocasia esculenta TaxID=4460 RepID=A0A843V8X1_COLES|nr:hypothetical protein [Colocasia esculenta]
MLWHLRACPSARCAFGVVTVFRDPHPHGPVEGGLRATSASVEYFSGRRGKRCWTAASSRLLSSLSWSGSRGVWSVAARASLSVLTASPYMVPESCREDRRGTVVGPDYGLWLCFVLVSHSDGRGDMDLWSSGKTPVGAPDHRLVEVGLWLVFLSRRGFSVCVCSLVASIDTCTVASLLPYLLS